MCESTSDAERTRYFLVAAERSGTTVLRLMLDHHPRISCLSEFEYAVDDVGDDGSLPEVAGFTAELRRDWIFKSHRFELDSDRTYPQLLDDLLEQKRRRDEKERAGAVVHRSPHRLLFLWPEARFIHLVRDPRDVAASCIAMGWAGNTWAGSRRWDEFERDWSSLRSQLPEDRFLEIRFEEIVAEPARLLDRICRFLGEQFDESMLRYPETTTYTSPDSRAASKWSQSLSPLSVRLVEARCGHRLSAAGYDLSGEPDLHITWLRRWCLLAQDKWFRIRFALRRLGPALYLTERLARRLGLRRLRERIDPKLEAVWRAHLK